VRDENGLRDALGLQAAFPPPSWVLLLLQELRNVGVPDMALTGRGRTTWWDFKHLDAEANASKARTDEVLGVGSRQHLTMRRLNRAGFARYIVWTEEIRNSAGLTALRTLIVNPENLENLCPEAETAGYDRTFVLSQIGRRHYL